MSNVANFTQLVCKNVSGPGKNISDIFDIMMCKKGINSFSICIFFTQILNEPNTPYDRYYYRVVLRRLGKRTNESKSYRVDNGVFWENEGSDINSDVENELSRHRTTRPGYSGMLNINYEVNFEIEGFYEVDLYVKQMDENETEDSCEKMSVKDLQLVAISPFQVLFDT